MKNLNDHIPNTLSDASENPLALLMTINHAILYLGDYYKLTFSLINQSFNALSNIEINCLLPAKWSFSTASPHSFPAYIPLLQPGESLNFTFDLRLIDLPHESINLIYSSASYHINNSPQTYVTNSNAITVYTSPIQAQLTITNHSNTNNLISYEIIIRNRGITTLYAPILYIFLDPSYKMIPNHFLINTFLVPDTDPSRGIKLPDMAADCFYVIHLTARYASDYMPPKPPDLQLTCGSLSFYPLS